MKFDDLDALMRAFEDTLDARLPADGWIVARLDGRGFSGLTQGQNFAKPFDERFRDLMLQAARRVVESGFPVLFGTTHSDEISLLLAPQSGPARLFEGKARKYISLMASEASAAFSLALRAPVAFDCRLCVLPDQERVADYFRWRMADSERNALSAHAYWMLRSQGQGARAATKRLDAMAPHDKKALLAQSGIDFDALPAWQRLGVGLVRRQVEIMGRDPRTGIESPVTRRRLQAELELPRGDELSQMVRQIMQDAQAAGEPNGEPK